VLAKTAIAAPVRRPGNEWLITTKDWRLVISRKNRSALPQFLL
jgi:hypothetical protein